jgi:hypothetical protein
VVATSAAVVGQAGRQCQLSRAGQQQQQHRDGHWVSEMSAAATHTSRSSNGRNVTVVDVTVVELHHCVFKACASVLLHCRATMLQMCNQWDPSLCVLFYFVTGFSRLVSLEQGHQQQYVCLQSQ